LRPTAADRGGGLFLDAFVDGLALLGATLSGI
jgi:hypothetical protein